MLENAHSTRQSNLARYRSRHTHQQGSLLILCVTVLVIIALIGIAYLQRVRTDQFATNLYERSYINMVINGILDEVNTQVELDVEKNLEGGFLLYDYPWTDFDETTTATSEYMGSGGTRRTVPVSGYDSGDAPQDDRWLASTFPVKDDGEIYHWLHLTNLTGIWLEIPDPLRPGGDRPVEQPIKFERSEIGVFSKSDTDLTLSTDHRSGLLKAQSGYQLRGVDADGDGIEDSRWQWTPESVRTLGGRKYVMALRIVDLNSLLNINTAAVSTYTSGMPNAPYVANGGNPAWVDLSRLFARSSFTTSAQWREELYNILDVRTAPLLVSPRRLTDEYSSDLSYILTSNKDMRTLWELQGSLYGNLDRGFLMDSELELRRGAGVNNIKQVSKLEVQMGQSYSVGRQYSLALRQNPSLLDSNGGPFPDSGEVNYLTVVDLPTSGVNTYGEGIARWFYGDNNGNPTSDADSVAVKNRQFPAIRQFLTAYSGIGAYAPTPNPATFRSNRLKYALNRNWSTPQPGELDELIEQLEPVFKSTSTPYLGLDGSDLSRRTPDDIVNEYAAVIRDYSDPDNVPNQSPNDPTVYGMEKLPFLREVYVQALYADKNLYDAAGLKPGDAGYLDDGLYETWEYDESSSGGTGGDTRAMVIELGNPFSHRIVGYDPATDAGLDGRVRIIVRQGGTQIGSWEFDNQTPDMEARDGSSDADTMLVYSPPIDKIDVTLTTGSGTEDGSDLPGDLNFPSSANEYQVDDGALTSENGGLNPGSGSNIEVEMQVLVSNGTWVAYDRMTLHNDASLPADIDHSSDKTAAPNHKFVQVSSARDCRDINFVVDDGPGLADSSTNIPSDSSSSYQDNVDRFGNDTKGSNQITQFGGFHNDFFDKLQLPHTDEPMRSLAELGMIHMLGFTDTETFSERMSAIAPAAPFKTIYPQEHFLVVNPNDPEYEVIPSFGVPHAALLMDMFTTVSPEKDRIDNDNDDGNNDPYLELTSIDNDEELFIPGVMNINTAPMHLLTLGSPLGEDLDESERLMRAIVAYRDEPIRNQWRTAADQKHGAYWSTAVAGFDVEQIRTPNVNEHLRDFSTAAAQGERLYTPGIASLGEVLYINPNAGAPNSPSNMLRYGIDAATALPPLMDNYPDRDDSGGNSINQGDDNEQLLARFGMLSQAYSVRSDRFVVYGVVRGYEDDAFDAGPVETAKFIAIIDRGTMYRDSGYEPRVIGYIRLQ